jgi:hypothetical protein
MVSRKPGDNALTAALALRDLFSLTLMTIKLSRFYINHALRP